jgi:hypothetical protein
MATNIDKALNQAPLGLNEEDLMSMMGEPAIEIEIEDPDSVSITADGMEITLIPEDGDEPDFDANLANFVSEDGLVELASDIISEYEEDVNARRDWMQTYVDGLELLGMQIEERTEPWEGACGVYHPCCLKRWLNFKLKQ